MDFRKLKLYQTPIILTLACLAFYFSFAYDLARDDFIKLAGLYAALFFLSFKLIQMQKQNFWILVSVALVFRLVFIMALPNLSQDYFRFIWDGRLIANGWNPYEFIPLDLISVPDFDIASSKELLKGMGSLSASHFTNYAPVNQLIFALGGWLAPSHLLFPVIFFRIAIILADLGTLVVGRKLLISVGLPEYRIFWYILNPFIIIELTGNLHFEGVMVFFLISSLYLLHKGKWLWSAVLLGLSVSVKLLPLMFLPLLLRYFVPIGKTNKNGPALKGVLPLLGYYLVVFLIVVFSFAPFYSPEVVQNFFQSIGLWFGKFEFNASIYYLVREMGYAVKGYNIIETAGKILPLITLIIILGLSLFRKTASTRQLITNMLLAVTAYLFLSTTIHPWYLAIPLVLSIFTEFRYIIVWTAVVIFSYFAYSNSEYQENLWLVSLEYLIVLGYFAWELAGKKAGKSPT